MTDSDEEYLKRRRLQKDQDESDGDEGEPDDEEDDMFADQRPSAPQPGTQRGVKRKVLDPDQLREEAHKMRSKRRRLAAGEAIGLEGLSDDEPQAGMKTWTNDYANDLSLRAESERDGVRLESFNMRDELENGTIDVKTGAVNTRARGEDEEEEEEEWLQEFDKQAKADDSFLTKYERDLARVRERERMELRAEQEAEDVDRPALLRELAELLNWGETVGRALKRITPEDPRKARLQGKNKKDAESAPSVEDAKKKETWSRLVEIADALVGVGLTSLYEMTREEVEDKLDETLKAGEAIWVYKWNRPDTDPKQVFGPFSTRQMSDWLKEGFFGEQEEAGKTIFVCRQGEARFKPLRPSDFE